MHLRLVHNRAPGSGKDRRYAQLVQSFRRPDGMPAHRVVANLGELDDREVFNLKLALDASRKGKTLVLPETRQLTQWPLRVLANLEYLHLAVALRIWEYWKLGELFNRLLPKGGDAVVPGDIIAALTLQRCIAPGSKLYAQRWFPRTALPELLDLDIGQFNNTRLHRVLEQLDEVDSELQEALPVRYQQHDGAFLSLFMDVTDTWFEGRGCDLADRDRTKEGFTDRYKIGIVLLCTDKGYPLRWKVVGGKQRDAPIMTELLQSLEKLPWIGDAPLVCDRAMGQAGSVTKLVDSGHRFLTAVPRTEIASYGVEVPTTGTTAVLGLTEATYQDDIKVVAAHVESAGMLRVEEKLFVLDLGVKERELTFPLPELTDEPIFSEDELTGAAFAIVKARRLRSMLDEKVVKNQTELARREQVTTARITQLLSVLRLAPELQTRVLAGEFGYVSEHFLRECVRYQSKQKQLRMLEDNAQLARPAVTGKAARTNRSGRRPERLRCVLYFNPQLCIDQRTAAEAHRQSIEDFTADINRRLRSERARLTPETAQALLHDKLASHSYLRLYTIQLDLVGTREDDSKAPQLRLLFDEHEWRRRRRNDGFVLLVAHPEIPMSARELVELYRAKDAVEKDFQTIKDVVRLRPVYHHTDPKVRAHVTLCMLALLLERTLEQRLRRSSIPMTAPACFETLASCHLNLLQTDPDLPPTYGLTEPNTEQRDLLKVLRMTDLVDPEEVAARMRPRAPTQG